MTLLYLALAWVDGLPGGAPAAALLPPLGALLLWWGVGSFRLAEADQVWAAEEQIDHPN